MKIIFFGSDDFALTHLESLAKAKHEVLACVTQPDKPKGRGLQVSISPIKIWALEHHVKIFQPQQIIDEDFLNDLKKFNADLFIVIAYGKFLPNALLNAPKICAINIHGSLLPKYRGAAPINWAILNGEIETGVTIMKMNAAMDAGEIISQAKLGIDSHETALELRKRMMNLGADLLIKTLEDIKNNSWTLTPQDLKKVSFAPKLTKEMGKIHWEKSAQEIYNLIRALQPWPSGYTFFQGKILKIITADVMMQKVSTLAPATISAINDQGFVVVCGKDALLIKQVHLESSKPMDALSFIRGQRLVLGSKLE